MLVLRAIFFVTTWKKGFHYIEINKQGGGGDKSLAMTNILPRFYGKNKVVAANLRVRGLALIIHVPDVLWDWTHETSDSLEW